MTEEILRAIEARAAALPLGQLRTDIELLVAEVRSCWRQIQVDEKAIQILNAELERLRAAQEH